MIVDLKIGQAKESMNDGFIEISSIYGSEKIDDNICMVYVYGGSTLYLGIGEQKLREYCKEAKSNNGSSGYYDSVKTDYAVSDVVEFGDHKFRLDIHDHVYDSGIESRSLQLSANFLVQNDALKATVESIYGVENMNDLVFSRYETSITVGKMFNIKSVQREVEKKIKDFMSM